MLSHSARPVNLNRSPGDGSSASLKLLATRRNGLMLSVENEPARELHEFGRAGLDRHPADHPCSIRSKEIAGTRPRNGSGGKGVSKSKGRVQRRTAQGREA